MLAAVRDADAAHFRTLADLRGKTVVVGTLGSDHRLRHPAAGRARLRPARRSSHEDDVHPYSDLVIGRVDAVLLDNVLAERRQSARTMPGFTIQATQTVAIGHYVGVLSAANAPLRDSFNEILLAAMRDGRLEKILRTWSVWNDDQPQLYAADCSASVCRSPPVIGFDTSSSVASVGRWEAARRYLPSLLRASVVTIALSCLSMGLAVLIGVLIATGRVYARRTGMARARCSSPTSS